MSPARYHTPRSLEEALALLDASENSMVYGGGTAIQILAQQGILHVDDLVDIGAVPDLDLFEETADTITVGPMVSIRAMELEAKIAQRCPLVAQTYRRVANPRVRNTASVGGNIAHGDYRLDPPTALLVLDAHVRLSSVRGVRQLPIREFFVDFQLTALRHGEMITGITVPTQPERAFGTYVKLSSLSANDWPAASVAALYDATSERPWLRLGLGALAPTPVYVDLDVTALGLEDTVAAAIEAVEPLLDPIPDVRGSATYKRALGLSATRDAVEQVWKDCHAQ